MLQKITTEIIPTPAHAPYCTKWIQTSHRGFSKSDTRATDAKLCPQVTLGSQEPIMG